MSLFAEYAPSVILYDRSDYPIPGSNIVPNLGTDIADKLHYIITNYNNLPDVCIYTKANLFKYISKEEFELVKDNQEFTPLLTKNHKETLFDGTEEYVRRHGTNKDVSFYMNGIYWELANCWFLHNMPLKHDPKEVMKELGIDKFDYFPMAPGSNYILTKKDILKHPVEKYIKLYNYLTYCVYPAEAMLIERGLYTLWH